MIVYVVYSVYSEAYNDPSIFFEVCATKEKAQEIFEGYKSNTLDQARRLIIEEEDSIDDIFNINVGNRVFECREIDGDKAWEIYIIEQEVLT